MPFSRPILPRLIRRIQSDIETRLPGVTAKIKGTVEYVLARVEAGVAHSLHGHLDWVSKQILPDTAEGEHLLRWGEILKTSRNPATKAVGTIQVNGVVAANVPAFTQWQYNGVDDGVDVPVYQNPLAAVVGENGFILVEVEALVAGAAGNVPAGEVVTLVSPVANLEADAAVVAFDPIEGGVDIEPLDPDYRERVLFAIRNPPKGGGPGDYIAWALGVPGATRAWELGSVPFPGAVTVLVVNDKTDPIAPSAELLAAVQAAIELVMPITVTLFVEGPELIALDPTIELDTDTPELRAAVTAELVDLLASEDYRDGTLKLSLVNEAISNAPGWDGHTLTSPVADQSYGAKQIPVLGTITWV